MALLRRSTPDSGDAPRPGARERSRMRRRLRRQRQMREALLLDLGALVFELHRHGRREPELLQAKAAELTAVDEEVRALAEALGSDHTVMQLVATGVAGSCENCGALMSVDARYCASCGAPAVPALAGDGERRAFGPEAAEGRAALADRSHQSSVVSPQVSETVEDLVEDEQAAAEPEEALDEEPAWEETAASEPSGEETATAEGVISVSRVEAEVTEPEVEEPPVEEPEVEEPEPAEPEVEEPPEPEVEEPEPEVEEPARPPWGAPEGDRAEASAAADGDGTEEPPRALADDALDSAAKAIRSGLARGRDWIRGRRTGD